MPDEVKTTPTGDQGPAPAFDADAFRKAVQDEVQQYMSTQDKGSVEDQTPQGPQPTVNPLEAVIGPIVGPHILKAQLDAAAAEDAAIFYTAHPEAIKHRVEIEKGFKNLRAQGTPFTREAVYSWWKGANEDTRFKERQEEEQKKLDAAKGIVTVDGGIRPSVQLKNAEELSQEELSKTLKDITF